MIHNMTGGAGLKLKVVGGTAAPASPKENTVWVSTDTEIRSYAFSATEPENPTEGMVWFTTGLSSSATMNVDKKNTVMLYPLSCKQYISGAWVTKTAKTYQGGAWKEWSLYFYNEGDKCEDVTGGWATVAKGLDAEYPDFAAAPSVSYNAGNVKISQQGNKAGLWYTKNKISLTGRKKLTVKTTGYSSDAPNSAISLRLRTGLSGYVYDETVASQWTEANGTFSIDLSALSASDTKYHVCIAIYSTCSITVEKLYAE